MGRGAAAVIDWRSKGLPAESGPVSRDAIAALGWNLLNEDLMLPAAVLLQSAIVHNSSWMRRFTELTGARIAPHGKTTMSRELFAQQLADGAWGLTAATIGHVRTYREFGVERIILANQLIGKQNVAYIAAELARDPNFDFYCLVDSLAGLERLEFTLLALEVARPVQVLIELGYAGGRAGFRDDAEAKAVAKRVAASPVLSLRGVEGFEGIVQGSAGAEGRVSEFLARILNLGKALAKEKLFDGVPILTAGGSSFFDLVADCFTGARSIGDFEIVLRSGCYLVHDSKFYLQMIERLLERSPAARSLGEGLKPALQLWAYVHSRPEPTRLIVGLGKRDCAEDVAPPNLIGWCRPGDSAVRSALEEHRIIRLDDQHAYLDIPADSPLDVGDMVVFGVSHPCTTFDKWRTLFVVDDALKVVDFVETNF